MFHNAWHNSRGLKVQFLLNYTAGTWVQGKTYYIAAHGFSTKSTYLYKFLILQKKDTASEWSLQRDKQCSSCEVAYIRKPTKHGPSRGGVRFKSK